jgi:hypothetical protein
MTLFRVVAHKERAGLFRAGPFMNPSRMRWVRGFEMTVTEWNSRSRSV